MGDWGRSCVWLGVGVAVHVGLGPAAAAQAQDSTPPIALPPVHVTVVRAELPLSRTPHAVTSVDKATISLARPTWGLDEALLAVPGVYTANRYNFSLDQRISIRGFGSRSAFAVRGVKVFIDGVPQTLPDGQGQLTNLDLGLVDRIEVLRGASSVLYGNASGGVISAWTNPLTAVPLGGEVRATAGAFDRGLARAWSKWQSAVRFRAGGGGGGGGGGLLHVSRFTYEGQRDHSRADLRHVNARLQLPLGADWSLLVSADVGDQPRADNPGALTAEELATNRDQAAALNLSQQAGKDVLQAQGGLTLRRRAEGGDVALTVFGLTRDLRNPQTFAYIDIDRTAYGARATVTRDLPLGGRPHRVTAGLDLQRMRDARRNHENDGGRRTATITLDQLERVSELGPFVQSAIELTPFATLTAGLRYDRVSFRVDDHLVTATNPDDSGRRLMDAVSGSAGVTLGRPGGPTFYASVGSSFETPTTTELANRPDTAGGFNAGLAPQHARHYEVGLRAPAGAAPAGGAQPTWSVAVFRADVRDLLASYEIPTSPQRRFYRNAGRARHEGVELGASARPAPWLTLLASWTMSRFRYVDHAVVTGGGIQPLDGRPIPGIPAHWVRLLARAQPAAARGAWIELEQAASSGYLVDDTMDVRTSGWTVTHVRIGWDGTRLRPFVGVQNLFDRRYVGSVVINAARGRYFEPAPGRNAYLGLSVGMPR